MKLRAELSAAEVETAIHEYLQRTLSTHVSSVKIESADVNGAMVVDLDVGTKKKQGGTTRCGACGGYGHNISTCTVAPRADNDGGAEAPTGATT